MKRLLYPAYLRCDYHTEAAGRVWEGLPRDTKWNMYRFDRARCRYRYGLSEAFFQDRLEPQLLSRSLHRAAALCCLKLPFQRWCCCRGDGREVREGRLQGEAISQLRWCSRWKQRSCWACCPFIGSPCWQALGILAARANNNWQDASSYPLTAK